MPFSKRTNKNLDEKYKIVNKKPQNESNEIKLIKRTLENNTHEVIEDTKLKRITSWRKSQSKFLQSLIYNILSFGIIHLISLFYPNLYIKLYCNPCQGKDCDYFLVEDIYGYFTLCLKIHKKEKNNNHTDFESSKDNFISSINSNQKKNEYYLIRNLTYSFIYKSTIFEYNDETNEIIPVYMNLSKMTNKGIFNFFSEGLSTENKVNKFKQRYGLNEYIINTKILVLYYKKIEMPNYFLILLNGIVELILKDYIAFIIKIFIILSLIAIQYIFMKKAKINLLKKDYTIDGEKNLKVKRKYLMKDNNLYAEIKNKDLLPGDIIFLKSNDVVPCDCLIMEGECIANESNLTGSLDIFRKTSLENNNEEFNYKCNNVNILFHGMKIIKTISKLNEGFISVLCINTGANTYKANQYSNILYLSERRKDYNENYNFLGGERKIIFVVSICLLFFCALLCSGYVFIFNMTIKNFKDFLHIILIRAFCKSLMPVYHITNSIIIFLSIFRLKYDNIYCFDKSRLINNSGKIDTIFISKTGTLCKNKFEVKGYYPVYMIPHKQNSISYKEYKHDQCKEMNIQLLKYYKDYQKKKYNNNIEINRRYPIRRNHLNNSNNNQYNEYIALFLECILSCNNIDKFNTEIYGNIIETTIFNEMKWDIKVYDNYELSYSKILKDKYSKSNNKNYYNLFHDNKFVYLDKKICDIYPKNYYKITESSKKDRKNKQKRKSNYLNENLKVNVNEEMSKISKKNTLRDETSTKQNVNPILNDENLFNINSYKLRIFKKFIIYGTLNSSAIVYNFLTKELRFMIKGMVEEILDKCDIYSLPENFNNIISHYRRNGFIIIICATKLISIEEYNDLNDYDYYLNNLTFCGFILLKNILKDDIKKSINDLKNFNCNLIITSGDNEYNCLSVGFDSGIIENKSIFVFDKDDKKDKILIRKIYNGKNYNENNDDETTEIKSNNVSDKYSKQKKQFNQNNYIPIYKAKESKNLKYNNSLVSSKRSISDNKDLDNQNKDLNEKEWKTPQVKNENKNIIKNRLVKRKSKFNLVTSKNLLEVIKKDRFKNISINSEFYDISINETKNRDNLFRSIANRQNLETKKMQDSSSHKKNKNSIYKYNSSRTNTFTKEYERFYYYQDIFSDYEDLKDNSIYCISGKALNYLYNNRNKKEYRILLKQIHKYCKIYFRMSSIDKSITIDFYKEYPNSYICKIGECQSDFDPIMTSNAGINLRAPKNFNTILCHFYSEEANIICIQKIIMEGRIVDENISLLKISSYFCTMILNSYIFTCFIRNNDVVIGQLNFLESTLLIFSILAFTGKPDNNYALNPLVKNVKLFNSHFYIQIIGIFLIKIIAIYFASKYYITNFDLQIEKIDKIFITYYFILSIELIFSIIFSLNFISFSRQSLFSNTFYILFVLFLFLYYIILVSLNSSNFKFDFFKISFFEYQEKLIDSFDDKNRMNLIVVCVVDFFASFFYTGIVKFIFYKIAEYKTLNKEVESLFINK